MVAAGLAFCTLEIAFVLAITLAICCWAERRQWRVDGRFITKSLALFVATVLAIWPAALIRLSFVKAFAVLSYLAVARDSAWGNTGFIESWRVRILNSPVEWTLIVLGLVLGLIGCLRYRGVKERLSVYPLGIFAALMLIATVRVVTVTPRYSLAFVPVLDVLAGLALVPCISPLRRPASFAVVALAVAGLYGNAWYDVVHQPYNPNPRSAAVVTYIHQNRLENKAVLAPQADIPTLHYYFPGMRLRGYFGMSPTPSDKVDFQANATIAAAEP